MSKELEAKVRPLARDAITHMEQKAGELVAALSGQFRVYAVAALAEIGGLLAEPRYRDETWRGRLGALAHDLKGLGSTFGYNLMTNVAGSMCRAIGDAGRARDESLHRRLAGYATALDAIVQHDLRGDGGAYGRDLLATLRLPRHRRRSPSRSS